MKTKIWIGILCLALMSLACLEVSATALVTTQPPVVATRHEKAKAPTAARPTLTALPSPDGKVCAVVVALKVQNLRDKPGTYGAVVGSLKNGEQVQVLGVMDADWWSVQRGKDLGYARASYLRIAECVK